MIRKLTKTAVWALALTALGLYAHGTAHAAEATSSSSSQVSVTSSDQSAVVVQTDHSSTTTVGQSSNSNSSSDKSSDDNSLKSSSNSNSDGTVGVAVGDSKTTPVLTSQANSAADPTKDLATLNAEKAQSTVSTQANPVPVISVATAMTLPVRATLARANTNPLIPTAEPSAPVTDNHPSTPADDAGTMLKQLSNLLAVTVVPAVVSLTSLTTFLAIALPTAATHLPLLAVLIWLSLASLFVALLRRAGFTLAPRGPTAVSFLFATPVKMGLEGGNLPILSPIFSCWSQTSKGQNQIN